MIPIFRVWYNVHEGHMYPVMGLSTNEDGSMTANAVSKYDEWNPIQVSGKWKNGYLMQGIGRQDKNKKEIFVGDIISCDRYDSHIIYLVVIKDIRYIPQEMYGSALNSIQVEGNIFENPGLLHPIVQKESLRIIRDDPEENAKV